MTDAEFTEALHEVFVAGFMASGEEWNGDNYDEDVMGDLNGYFTEFMAELVLVQVA